MSSTDPTPPPAPDAEVLLDRLRRVSQERDALAAAIQAATTCLQQQIKLYAHFCQTSFVGALRLVQSKLPADPPRAGERVQLLERVALAARGLSDPDLQAALAALDGFDASA